MSRTKRVVAATTVAFLAIGVSACGGDKGSASGGKAVVVGTTETVSSLDPAGAYDYGSWEVLDTVFQKVMRFPTGGTTPEPDAAKSCSFTDPKTYSCTLNSGLTFSNGDKLTANDVKFSFDRMVGIAAPNGPSSLLANLDKTEAKGDDQVIFHLKNPDATFPQVLATDAGLIVDSKVYPKDKLLDGTKVVGSGPYTLDKYAAKQSADFVANKGYKGPVKLQNQQFIIQYFSDASTLKQAIQGGDVNVAFRTFSPTDVKSLQSASGLQVVQGTGTEKRYVVFDAKVKPVDQKPVRQAIAQVIDREAIAKQVYNGTVEPLYSMVGNGIQGQVPAFKDKYGAPDKDKAAKILKDAGISTPVSLQYFFTPSHYGPASSDEATNIKRQLEASGLFKVNVQSTEWTQYQKDEKADNYASYMMGWFPDFPDPDDDLGPFLTKQPFLGTGYQNSQIQDDLAKEEGSTDQNTRNQALADIQKTEAEDAPIIPVWQGKQTAIVHTGVKGADKALDPSMFRFYELSK
ncbi:ABC transporter substrate-binding protein [Streptantibioticus ferralitis]|uniref:ABC transporter substrate-binding protein n=1 Tax=Streptantibioticus ferralitis TaxID=236510 RepID=A0ABT5Z712_9ACTN|nr:ABC transporter substrate-binding protein [Streptantibioticus ferralitis]MDF2259627.1 ABC transporter substrate-binding protein [Streptantibioticus ferralitis]